MNVLRRTGTLAVLVARWVLLLGGVSIFVLVAAAVSAERVAWFDRPVLELVAQTRTDALTRGMQAVTVLGKGQVLGVLAALSALALWFSGLRRAALFIALSAAGSGALNWALKLLFERQRPGELLHLASSDGFSFPSGHSMGSASVYGALAIVLVTRFPRARTPALLAVGALVLVVGLSRIYLNVHYPTDVIAGWGLGISWPLWLRALVMAETSVMSAKQHPSLPAQKP